MSPPGKNGAGGPLIAQYPGTVHPAACAGLRRRNGRAFSAVVSGIVPVPAPPANGAGAAASSPRVAALAPVAALAAVSVPGAVVAPLPVVAVSAPVAVELVELVEVVAGSTAEWQRYG